MFSVSGMKTGRCSGLFTGPSLLGSSVSLTLLLLLLLLTWVTLLKNWLSLAFICRDNRRAVKKRKEMKFEKRAIDDGERGEDGLDCLY